MKKVGGLFTCSALALMAFAALPLSAAELTHRWSFNGDYSDSAGGADAVKCGTYVSLYGGRVHMGYRLLRGSDPIGGVRVVELIDSAVKGEE